MLEVIERGNMYTQDVYALCIVWVMRFVSPEKLLSDFLFCFSPLFQKHNKWASGWNLYWNFHLVSKTPERLQLNS